MKQYNASKERFREIKKTIYKLNPKWKKSVGIRIFFRILLLAALIVSVIFAWKNPQIVADSMSYQIEAGYTYSTADYISAFFIYLCIFVMIPGLIYFVYLMVSIGRCRGTIGSPGDVLISTDTELRVLYPGYVERDVDVIEYKKMKRIIWNECQQRFEFFTEVTKLHYIDYKKDKVDSRYKDTNFLKNAYHLYWIFPIEDLDGFKQELKQATGLELELKTEATE